MKGLGSSLMHDSEPICGTGVKTTAIGPPFWFPPRDATSFSPYSYTPITLPPDAQIAAVRLTTAPSGSGEMFPIELAVCGGALTVTPYSGVPGRIYDFRLEIEVLSGQVYTETVRQGTLPGLSGFPIPPAACVDYGAPLMWPCGQNNFGPAKNLPALTVAATGTTQLTAAVVPCLANILCNSATASNAGVIIAVPASTWAGYRVPFSNRSGLPVYLYLYSGDQFEGLGANAGTLIENDQTVTLSVTQSGSVLVQN